MITTTYYAIPTDVGRAALANAVVAGETPVITHIAVGNSGLPPDGTEQALRNELHRVPIHAIDNPGGASDSLVAEGVLGSEVGGFTVREAGLFLDDGTLLAIAKVPASDKVATEEGATTEFRIRIHVRVANADVVELSLDPSVVMASRQWVADQLAVRDLRIASAFLATMRNALVTDAVHAELTGLAATLASLDTKVAGLAQDQIYTARRTV